MLISQRDYIATGTLNTTDPVGGLYSTAYLSSAPFTNAQDRRLAVKAITDISVDPMAQMTVIIVDLAAPSTIGMVAALNNNFPEIDATDGDRIAMGAALFEGASQVATVLVSPAWLPPVGSSFPSNAYIVFDRNYTNITRVVFTLFRVSLAPISIGMSFGRLWAGPYWTPVHKTSQRDFNMQTRDDSVVTKSIGQQVYVDYKPRYRQLTCSIPAMTEAEAIGTDDGETPNLQDIAFEVGRGGEVIVIPTQSSAQAIHKFGVYGHFVDPPPVRLLDANKRGRIWTTTFDTVEDL